MAEKEFNFKRILSLGEDRVQIVEYYLISGKSCNYVADHIQTVWKKYKSIKTATLSKQIQRYKRSVVDHKLKVIISTPVSEVEGLVEGADGKLFDNEGNELCVSRSASGYENSTKAVLIIKDAPSKRDTIKDLCELVEVQKRRVAKLHLQEEKMSGNGILTRLTENIKLLLDMEYKLAKLQLENGDIYRVPKTLEGSLQIGASGEGAEIFKASLENHSKKKFIRSKVLKHLNKEVLGVGK